MVHHVVTDAPENRPAYLSHAPSPDDDHRSLLLRRRRNDNLTWFGAALRAQCHVRHLSGRSINVTRSNVETMQLNVECKCDGNDNYDTIIGTTRS